MHKDHNLQEPNQEEDKVLLVSGQPYKTLNCQTTSLKIVLPDIWLHELP